MMVIKLLLYDEPYLKFINMLLKQFSKIRIFPKAITRSFQTHFKFAPSHSMSPVRFQAFSTSKIPPQQLEELKRQGQQFYETQLSQVIELKSMDDFNTIVKSIEIPLLANFYADWNLACKTMTPRLEEKVKQSQGQVKLMNINIDKFGQIANIFQVKAVPTVFLVYKGKLIDGFTGQISDQMLNKFLETVSRVTQFDKADEEVIKALEEGQAAIRSGDYVKSEQILANLKITATKEEYGFVRNIFLAFVYGQLGKVSHLKALVEVMAKNEEFYVSKPEFKDLYLDLIERCKQNEKAQEENSEMTTWKKRIEQEPDNLQLKFEAALFYQQNELIEEALIQLLNIVKANKQWEEKKANKAILQIFKKLGNASPLTQNYRKLFQRALH